MKHQLLNWFIRNSLNIFTFLLLRLGQQTYLNRRHLALYLRGKKIDQRAFPPLPFSKKHLLSLS